MPGTEAERASSCFCSSSFARLKMSSMTRQFSAESLSSLREGVAVLLREVVRFRVERPKGPFSRVSTCEPLLDTSVSLVLVWLVLVGVANKMSTWWAHA
jgi:hypothetical protein